MEKAISFIFAVIMILLPCILVGWAMYYMRVAVKLKSSRTGFMNGSRNDFYQAVMNYEKMFSVQTDTNTEAFKTWKRKYSYLNEFLNFNCYKLGLDKDYLKIINTYLKYVNQ